MRNLAQPWRNAALSATTHRKVVQGALATDMSFRWVQHAAAGSATIAIYSADFLPEDDELKVLDPALNPFWTLEPTAVFFSMPAPAIESQVLTLSDNPFGALMVEVVVAVALTNFSFIVRSQGRASKG